MEPNCWSSIPWGVDLTDGVWRLHADLSGLRLGSLAVGGA